MPNDRDQAIELARKVLREGKLGVNPSIDEGMLLARELLRSLGLAEAPSRRREVLHGAR